MLLFNVLLLSAYTYIFLNALNVIAVTIMTYFITYAWIVFRRISKEKTELQTKYNIASIKLVKIINILSMLLFIIAIVYIAIYKFLFASQAIQLKTGRGILILNDSQRRPIFLYYDYSSIFFICYFKCNSTYFVI